MSRIKWNLDKLEEVKKQHDEFMESTEDVINKGREDLASMTKEVWEGEDSDMARELYDKLVYKNMPDTYKQLETCNESIQKAQKQAYEAKNFCNGFPQIFRDGSMPSDADEAPCGGELMCDEGSCEQLISSMEAAGQNAANVKSKTEMVESILASLETDEAKFDYASYTEPIKKQAQNVVDRTRTFNVALSRYMHKVDDLDRTLENELLNATPAFVPEPFDPASIDLGELVHMGDGDIVNFLEEHDSVDISDTFEVSKIESILEKLFGKKNIDISKLSEEDFEIAFLKLSEADQRKVLLGLGLSKTQIDSILASKDSKKTFIDGLYRSTSMDKIRKMDRKMPQYNNFGKPKDKTGGSKEKAPTPSAQSSSGVVECDNTLSYASAKLMPEYYDTYATNLIEAADKLCDDDPSNDEEAMKYISEFLEMGFYTEERNKKTYLMYDVDFLDYCKGKAGEGSLLYEWLEDLDDIFCEDGTYCSVDGDGPFPTCSFEMSKLGAGYQINLSIDFKDDDIQNVNEKVAYATTKELAERYFIKDGVLDYATLEEWFKLEGVDEDSIEFAVLANEMIEHQGDNVFYILEMGEYCIKGDRFRPDLYIVSNQLRTLATYYQVQAQTLQLIQGGYEDDCTRSAAFRALSEFMYTQGKGPHNIDMKTEVDAKGRETYIFNIKYKSFNDKDKNACIKIYPYGDSTYIDGKLKEGTKEVLNSFQNDLVKEILPFVFEQTFNALDLNISTLPYDALMFWKDMEKAYKQNYNVAKGTEMLDAGSAAQAMQMRGSVVSFNHDDITYAYVGVPSFDDVMLLICVETYNKYNEVKGNKLPSYSVEDMKSEYFEQSEEFKAYLKWYYDEGGSAMIDQVADELEQDLGKTKEEIRNDMEFEDFENDVNKRDDEITEIVNEYVEENS